MKNEKWRNIGKKIKKNKKKGKYIGKILKKSKTKKKKTKKKYFKKIEVKESENLTNGCFIRTKKNRKKKERE